MNNNNDNGDNREVRREPRAAGQAIGQQFEIMRQREAALQDQIRELNANPGAANIRRMNFEREVLEAERKLREARLNVPQAPDFLDHEEIHFSYSEKFQSKGLLKLAMAGGLGSWLSSALVCLTALARRSASKFPSKSVAVAVLLNIVWAVIKIYALMRRGIPYLTHHYVVLPVHAIGLGPNEPNERPEAMSRTYHKFAPRLSTVVYYKSCFGVQLPFSAERFVVSRSLFEHSHSIMNNDLGLKEDVLTTKNQRTMNSLPVNIPATMVRWGEDVYGNTANVKIAWLKSMADKVNRPFLRSPSDAPIT
nr:MAG: hypothetical protein [Chemarfal virus 277]